MEEARGPVAVGGEGGVELDPAELTAADAELSRWRDELSALLTEAGQLGTPLRDGGGPVAGRMHDAFDVRAQDVQSTLRDYLAEFDTLRSAIRRAGTNHDVHEAEVTDTLRALHVGDEGR